MAKLGQHRKIQDDIFEKKFMYGTFFRDLTVENLQYLNTDQAVEDLAEFIRVIRSTVPGATNSGIILVGASYSATVTSIFRQRYPEMVRLVLKF